MNEVFIHVIVEIHLLCSHDYLSPDELITQTKDYNNNKGTDVYINSTYLRHGFYFFFKNWEGGGVVLHLS